jgi:outer membrane lipoprotein-sorting protein
MSHRALRWLPAVIAPVVVAGAVAVPLAATASADLPAKSSAQVLALVAHARSLPGYSGELTQTSDLGLPQLPSTGPGSSSQTASALDLLTGSHRASIAVAGGTRSRVAVQDTMGERDVVRNGRTVWLWSSARNTVEQITVDTTGAGPGTRPERTTTMTPQSAAEEAIARITPSTDVTVETTTTVAGHAAYTLVLTPKTDATTVGSVRIAVDGTTGLPLRVQLFARGAASPAFEVGFTQLDYGVPAPSRFDFSAPSGAKVEHHTLKPGTHRHPTAKALPAKPTITGSGWDAVVSIPAADVPAALDSDATFLRLTQPAPAGGRALSTALVTVLRTGDGRVLAGAVPLSRLEALAAQG